MGISSAGLIIKCTKFGQLILRKIITIVATRYQILRQLEIRSMERGICPIATLALHLTYSLTGSRV